LRWKPADEETEGGGLVHGPAEVDRRHGELVEVREERRVPQQQWTRHKRARRILARHWAVPGRDRPKLSPARGGRQSDSLAGAGDPIYVAAPLPGVSRAADQGRHS